MLSLPYPREEVDDLGLHGLVRLPQRVRVLHPQQVVHHLFKKIYAWAFV